MKADVKLASVVTLQANQTEKIDVAVIMSSLKDLLDALILFLLLVLMLFFFVYCEDDDDDDDEEGGSP